MSVYCSLGVTNKLVTCNEVTVHNNNNNNNNGKKLSLFLINYVPRHENVWRSGSIPTPFFTSVLDGGEWLAPRPGRFTSGERAQSTHWIGRWVGLRAGLGR
jgi:hypothetical protein